jgi:hypothetical protein
VEGAGERVGDGVNRLETMTNQTSSGLNAGAQEARTAKTKNIIDMALDFTAMTRLFSKGAKPKILLKLEDLFARFNCIHEKSSYDHLHADFCDWFTKNIEVAEKKAKNSGRVIVAAHGSS